MIRTYKNMRGNWSASLQVDLANGYVLVFDTTKRSDGSVTTTARGQRLETSFLRHCNSSRNRCTETEVLRLLNEVDVAEVVNAAKQYYLKEK